MAKCFEPRNPLKQINSNFPKINYPWSFIFNLFFRFIRIFRKFSRFSSLCNSSSEVSFLLPHPLSSISNDKSNCFALVIRLSVSFYVFKWLNIAILSAFVKQFDFIECAPLSAVRTSMSISWRRDCRRQAWPATFLLPERKEWWEIF